MSKNRRKRLRTITIDNIVYKWLPEKEDKNNGITLKIWKDKILLIEEWYVSPPKSGITPERVKKIIEFEFNNAMD